MIPSKQFTTGLALVAAGFSCIGIIRIRAADTKSVSPVTSSAPVAAVATAGTPAVVPFETFRSIADRNIFDPNRVGRTARPVRSETRPTDDTISLVGTMDSEKGIVAFFDSPIPKFKKVLRAGEPIAEYTVSKVTAKGVELTRDGKTLSLQVAQQLRRPVGEDWTVAATELPRTDGSPDTSKATENATPPIPADASDTLKRLMEQRRNQLKE